MGDIEFYFPPADAARRHKDVARAVPEMEDLDLDKGYDIIYRERKTSRSDQQNAYYWGVVVEMISDASGFERDELHEYLCGLRWGWKDKKVPKTPRNPSGIESVPRRTTTKDAQGHRSKLKKMEFAEFVEFARRFAAKKLGIYIPDPDPNYQIKRERKAA